MADLQHFQTVHYKRNLLPICMSLVPALAISPALVGKQQRVRTQKVLRHRLRKARLASIVDRQSLRHAFCSRARRRKATRAIDSRCTSAPFHSRAARISIRSASEPREDAMHSDDVLHYKCIRILQSTDAPTTRIRYDRQSMLSYATT